MLRRFTPFELLYKCTELFTLPSKDNSQKQHLKSFLWSNKKAFPAWVPVHSSNDENYEQRKRKAPPTPERGAKGSEDSRRKSSSRREQRDIGTLQRDGQRLIGIVHHFRTLERISMTMHSPDDGAQTLTHVAKVLHDSRHEAEHVILAPFK